MQNKRKFFTSVLLLSMTFGSIAQAQSSAGSPAMLIVPSPPGNALDVGARQIQPELAKLLQRTVVVENVAGASGSIGAQKMLSAPPNSLSMVVGSTNEFVLPSLSLKSVNTKPSEFRLAGQLSNGVVAVLARPDLPANNLTELVALLKKKGGTKITYGSMGPGSITHLIGVDLSNRLGIEMMHVPYKGSTPAVQDLMGNQIDLTFLPVLPTYTQSAAAGKLKILGVMDSQRHSVLTSTQATDEVPDLKGFHYKFWVGVFVSSKAPMENAVAVNESINKILQSQWYIDMSKSRGSEVGRVFSLPEAQAFFESETRKMERLVKQAGIERE